jgi:primosomal protein N'
MKVNDGTRTARREALCRTCAHYTECDLRHIAIVVTPRTVKAVICYACGAQTIPTASAPGRCAQCGSDDVSEFLHEIKGPIGRCSAWKEAKL